MYVSKKMKLIKGKVKIHDHCLLKHDFLNFPYRGYSCVFYSKNCGGEKVSAVRSIFLRFSLACQFSKSRT